MDRVYAKNSEFTLGEVLGVLKDTLITIGDDLGNWDWEQPEMIQCLNVANQSEEYLYSSLNYVCLNQRLSGIPLYYRGSNIEGESSWDAWLPFRICEREAPDVSWFKVKITEILADDIPLCDFSAIKTALESEIEGGHIRKIFDMDLGYVLYNEPGVKYGVPRDQSKLPEAIYYSYRLADQLPLCGEW